MNELEEQLAKIFGVEQEFRIRKLHLLWEFNFDYSEDFRCYLEQKHYDRLGKGINGKRI